MYAYLYLRAYVCVCVCVCVRVCLSPRLNPTQQSKPDLPPTTTTPYYLILHPKRGKPVA